MWIVMVINSIKNLLGNKKYDKFVTHFEKGPVAQLDRATAF